MKIFSLTELMEEYSKTTSSSCIYMSFNKYASIEEVTKAAPFFRSLSAAHCKEEETLLDFHYLADHKVVLVFNTEKEMKECFDQIVNNGTIYAVTCINGILTDET